MPKYNRSLGIMNRGSSGTAIHLSKKSTRCIENQEYYADAAAFAFMIMLSMGSIPSNYLVSLAEMLPEV